MPAHTKVSQLTHSQEYFKSVSDKLTSNSRQVTTVAKGVVGKIVQWREERGFGFISVAPSSNFTEVDRVFCHVRALQDDSVGDYTVVQFDVICRQDKLEAANVHSIAEFKVECANQSGHVRRWDDSREVGWIQYDSGKSWVRFLASECLDGDVWVGLPVQFDLLRSTFDQDRVSARQVRALPSEVVQENLVGKVTFLSFSNGYGWISFGDNQNRASMKFLTKELISDDIHKGSVVSFDHLRIGDVDFAVRLCRASKSQLQTKVAVEKPEDQPCGVVWLGWVSRTFKSFIDDAETEVEHAVITPFQCDHDMICRGTELCKGDVVEFGLHWNSEGKIRPTHVEVVDTTIQVPLCKCGGRHLLTRCPQRKNMRFLVSGKGHEMFAHVGRVPVLPDPNSKVMSDQLSTCSTAAPLSELRE